MILEIASGGIHVSEQVNITLPALPGEVRALLLDNTTLVLSLGRRCIHEGHFF